jgi:hypothetical protein
MTITDDVLEAARSSNGGWSREQLRLLGVQWPQKKGSEQMTAVDELAWLAELQAAFDSVGLPMPEVTQWGTRDGVVLLRGGFLAIIGDYSTHFYITGKTAPDSWMRQDKVKSLSEACRLAARWNKESTDDGTRQADVAD